MLAMLEAAGTILLAILVLFLAIIFLLVIIGGYKALKKELKGGGRNGNNPKP